MFNKVICSIRFKLIAILSAIVIICVTVMGALVFNNMKAMFTENLKSTSNEAVKKADENINNFLKNNEDTIKMVTTNITITDAMYWKEEIDLTFLNNALENIKNAYPEIMRVYIAQPNNVVRSYPSMEVPKDIILAEREWYKGAVEKKGVSWTKPYKDLMEDTKVVTLSAPLTTSKGEAGGVIAFDISLSSIEKLVLEMKIGENGEISLLDDDNNVIVDKKGSEIGTPLNIKEIDNVLGKKESGSIDYSLNGVEKLAVFYKDKLTGWNIIGSIDYSEVDNEIKPILNIILVCGLFIVFIGMITIYLGTRKMVNSINIIKEKMEKVGEGDLTVEVNLTSRDEIGLVSNTLNSATSNIRSLMESVKSTSTNLTELSVSIAATSEETTASIEEISKAISEVATSTYEKNKSVEIGLDKANELSRDIEKITNAIIDSKEGFAKLDSLNAMGIEKVNELSLKTRTSEEAFIEVEKNIKEVNRDIEKIGSIIETISGIATQTNLLALNASIEAARASDKGRGFLVVANEVKKLASQSSSAIEKISNYIKEIELKSLESVEAMKISILVAHDMSKSVNETESVFSKIDSDVKEINEKMEEVISLNKEMLDFQGEIVDVIKSITESSNKTKLASNEISESTKKQLVSFEVVSETAEELNALVEEFNGEIAKFKI